MIYPILAAQSFSLFFDRIPKDQLALVMNVETFPVLPSTAAAALTLSPSQLGFYAQLENVVREAPVTAVIGASGSGRSVLVERLAAEHNGKVVSLSSIADALIGSSPGRMDEIISAHILEALNRYDLVVVDDFDRVAVLKTTERENFLRLTIIPRMYDCATALGKKLVLVGGTMNAWMPASEIFGERATVLSVPAFQSEDYASIAGASLGEDRVKGVDFKLIHRLASMLDGYQLRLMCQLLANELVLDTDAFVRCVENWILASNLRLKEVEELTFDSLPGAEHIAEALETNVVLPFENPELALQMGLKPKRGVLLYGPPGTGKTSIGRALAHRMNGKFFLIDGTFVSEPPTIFFGSVQAIVAEAKANSPCVLFIDDADLLFQIEHIGGLARYLLSLLDGLESETASNVCVLMTAMDVRNMPEALMRSGRVELWLETRLPDKETRGRILQRWMPDTLPGIESIDYGRLADATKGFTPADLRRTADDAKLLYAADVVENLPLATATDYLLNAINEIIAVRGRMADQLGDDTLRVGNQV